MVVWFIGHFDHSQDDGRSACLHVLESLLAIVSINRIRLIFFHTSHFFPSLFFLAEIYEPPQGWNANSTCLIRALISLYKRAFCPAFYDSRLERVALINGVDWSLSSDCSCELLLILILACSDPLIFVIFKQKNKKTIISRATSEPWGPSYISFPQLQLAYA